MLKSSEYWVIFALAALSVVLAATNAGLFFTNRSLQQTVSARAQYLQQSQSIGTLYQEIARTLAKLAVEHKDEEVKALLRAEGFTLTAGDGTETSTRGKP